MTIKMYEPEQIVRVLRQIEVVIGNGKAKPQACTEAGIYGANPVTAGGKGTAG